ncbi:OmpA family protein [Croceitalea dokdonensis]|uniref:OmpA family protein n=1 Tax=Croceitalea dokdonensis TaxID=346188 RepID=UPI0006C9F2EC|nr:OmpA family protein [Croceitalea dokdonensis]
MLKFNISYCLLFSVGLLTAQNLVKNPSFELFDACPEILGSFNEDVRYWSTPTLGTTDYFNTCSKRMGAPENFNGIQQPSFGNAYAGLYFYAPGDYREYIQVPLEMPLRQNENYKLSFFISLAEGSDFAVKDFGVVMAKKALRVNTKRVLSKKHLFGAGGNKVTVHEVNHPTFHEDKTDWLQVTLEFTAQGFERFLVLGNLRDNKRTKKIQTKRKETKKGAYYYIDMVSLQALDSNLSQIPPMQRDSLYVFKAITFGFDDIQLSNLGTKELRRVFMELKDHPELQLEIHGHTDAKGGEDYNQRLSYQRAVNLANHLIRWGIDKSRISCFGHGASKPISSNQTEGGRAKNRRVEFLFKTTSGQ